MLDIKKILACPKCKKPFNPKNNSGKCKGCHFPYKFQENIWHLLYTNDKKTKKSRLNYDRMHQKVFEGPTDGSYEILAKFAKGNRAVDIACGDGFIEKLAPETVGVEFSKNALLNAKKMGARHLVLADAHNLPFIKNAFDISISTGNIEQFASPVKAVSEMVRISKIQIITAHREFNFPFAKLTRSIFSKVTFLKNQPIEIPIKNADLEKMITSSGAKIIYKGLWTIPVNHGRVVKFLPEFKNISACSFFISIKNDKGK